MSPTLAFALSAVVWVVPANVAAWALGLDMFNWRIITFAVIVSVIGYVSDMVWGSISLLGHVKRD